MKFQPLFKSIKTYLDLSRSFMAIGKTELSLFCIRRPGSDKVVVNNNRGTSIFGLKGFRICFICMVLLDFATV